MKIDSKIARRVVIPLIIALISVFVLSKFATSPEFHAKTIASLDNKKATATGLTAATSAASIAVTLLPDDVATPLSEQLIDLSSYLLIILSAIYLEKYLLTITGFLTFKLLIPLACLLYIVNIWIQSDTCKNLIRKMVIIGLVLVCVIPASEKVSSLIEDTHGASIEATMNMAKQEIEVTEEEEEGGLSAIISSIGDSVTGAAETAKNVLNNLIEAIAVMIVTTCVIPILVFVFLIWFIKFMLGININLPKMENLMFVKKGVRKLNDKKQEFERKDHMIEKKEK